ncbi:DUF6221 family protein [Micromonospora fulviviridis]|uniref:DUF6221 family protein n=1 Tax=Micromonospora fulviviridis TaxID=47860 RepID=UPI0037A45789
MDDLVTWLRQQLDEDERVARAADSSRWLPEDKGITFEYTADDFHEGEAQARLAADTRANQEHIARHDPERVLAEVEAKRRILDECEWRIVDFDPGHGCAQQVLAFLALPFADRPGYRAEWRP